MSGKTEWEDALIEHGIMAAPEVEPDQDELYADDQERQEQEAIDNPYKHLFGKDLDQLKEHEDEVDEDSMEVLRKRRLAQLKRQAARNKFGRVINISEPEWKAEVTEAEPDVWVVVNLYTWGKQECKLLDDIHSQLAGKFKDVKFVRIEGRHAIRNFPDDSCPTLLVYLKGDIKLQLVGINSMGGLKVSANSLEWVLAKIGAVQTEMTEDPSEQEQRTRINRLDQTRKQFEDEGDDWLED